MDQPVSGAGFLPLRPVGPPNSPPPSGLDEPLLIRPRLAARGRLLLFSDSPESVTEPGVLYRDQQVARPARVFLHHYNQGKTPVAIYLCVKNQSREATAVIARSSGAAAGLYPAVAGQQAFAQYLRNPSSLRVDLPPGRWGRWGIQSLPPGQTFSGIYDLDPLGPVAVAVLAARPGTDPDPQTTPALPRDGRHQRGTWLFGDRAGQIHYRASQGVAATPLANDPGGGRADSPWQWPLPGEFQLGLDRLSWRVEYLMGNYGVLYRLQVLLENDRAQPATFRLGIQPRGGDWLGMVAVGNKALGPEGPIPARETWWFWQARLQPGAQQRLTMRWLPTGGSFLPVRLLCAP